MLQILNNAYEKIVKKIKVSVTFELQIFDISNLSSEKLDICQYLKIICFAENKFDTHFYELKKNVKRGNDSSVKSQSSSLKSQSSSLIYEQEKKPK